MTQAIAKFLDISDRTVYNWKKEKRPVIDFLYTYFDSIDLYEYMGQGKMNKLEHSIQMSALSRYEMSTISRILEGAEEYAQSHKVDREGFLIKLYRATRSYRGGIEDFAGYLDRYDLESFSTLRNVIWGPSFDDIKDFYLTYLSKKEQETLFSRKFFILPALKSMRKYNSHLKD